MTTLFGKTVMGLLPAKSLRRALVNSASTKLRWKLALPCEEKFWAKWLAEQGGEYGDNFRERLNPLFELQEHVRGHIAAAEGATVRILDVGAGPLTVLGKVWRGRKVELVAVDPLANDYARLLKKHDVVPPVKTAYCEGERVGERFDENRFDLVYSRNALDHSHDPMGAIRQMVKVCKPGCVVLMENGVNEGEHEKYYGLHQWNFSRQEGRFVIWNKHCRVDVAEELEGMAGVSCEVEEELKWLTVVMRKR